MRPYPEEIIKALQSGVMAHFAPDVKSSYGQAQFAFAMLLFGVATRDYDSAAQDLVENNAALRGLLRQAREGLTRVDREDAREALSAADGLPPAAGSVRLSELRAEWDALRETLVRLVPVLEPAGDDGSLAAMRPVREAIYAWLRRDAQRRVVPILTN
jgi:hypothetical protein